MRKCWERITCWEKITSYIGKHKWLIPSALFLTTLLFFFLLLFHWKASLAASAQILFSGFLLVTSVLLFTIQRALNNRDDVDLVLVKRPDYEVTKSNLLATIHFVVTNPAPMAARLSEVRIANSELGSGGWKIESWHRMDGPPDADRHTIPALLRPNETIFVRVQTSVDEKRLKEANNIKKFKWCFVYQIGNYKMKQTSYKGDVKSGL